MGSSVWERLHRYFYRYWPWAVDMLFAVCALPVAFLVRFEGDLPGGPLSFSWGYTLLIVALVRGAVNYTFGFYRQLWEYAGRREFILIAKATASGSLLITAFAYMRFFPVLPQVRYLAGLVFLYELLWDSFGYSWRPRCKTKKQSLPGKFEG